MNKLIKNLSFISFSLLAITACNESIKSLPANNYSRTKGFDWLVGTWENQSKEGKLTEAWEKMNDSTFKGRSYFVSGTDTSFSESISLVQRNGVLLYIPAVKDQNNGLSISFRLITMNEKDLIFENAEHDYPQRISYHHVSKDSLIAEISGNKGGELKSEQFPMRKLEVYVN
jgi:hypothetical protein